MGWGGALEKALGMMQTRKERWRNQISALENERAEILKGRPNAKTIERVSRIDADLHKLYELCKNEQ